MSTPAPGFSGTLLLSAAVVLATVTLVLLVSFLKPDANSSIVGLDLERVETQAARQKGLSGRDSLPAGKGMLFVFDSPGRQCIWMKDMKFSIDIVWLDTSAKVLKLEEHVSPDTYPKTFCFDNTAYIIELSSGRARSLGVVPGAQIDL